MRGFGVAEIGALFAVWCATGCVEKGDTNLNAPGSGGVGGIGGSATGGSSGCSGVQMSDGLCFAEPAQHPIGGYPMRMAIADFSGDALADVIVCSQDGAVLYLPNDGTGVFKPAVALPSGTFGPCEGGIAIGDADGDGDNDVALVQAAGLRLLRNAGGQFEPLKDFSKLQYNLYATAAAFGDYDGDKDADLVTNVGGIILNNSGSFDVYGSGSGGSGGGGGGSGGALAGPNTWGKGGPILLDLDRDGDPDWAHGAAFWRNGGGAFALAQTLTPAGDGAIAPGDFDADGRADLARTSGTNVTVNLNSASEFLPGKDYSAGVTAFTVAVGDLDGDTDNDLLVGSDAQMSIALLRNDGTGAFTASKPYSIQGGVGDVAVADLNGDTALDVVVAGPGLNVTVLIAVP